MKMLQWHHLAGFSTSCEQFKDLSYIDTFDYVIFPHPPNKQCK